MSKHTKDKWVVGSGPKRMKVMAGDYCVAYVYPEPGSNAYPLRRLNLIAAAPEMYELLVNLAFTAKDESTLDDMLNRDPFVAAHDKLLGKAMKLLARIDEGGTDEIR